MYQRKILVKSIISYGPLENNIKVQSLHIAKLSPSENMILSTSIMI